MARLGPFEAAPRLAVGVSGGADSMALVLLAQCWARRRGGTVVALTVDHGLRPEAAAEARQVKAWLARRSIEHRTLSWRGRPAGSVQAAARHARYRLLGRWCRRAGVLHLAVAHTLEDQAETLLLRLAGGSGIDGLAAMAAVGELPAGDGPRLIRPLLGTAKARLRATLSRLGQDWIEDPSNRDARYARVRLRALMPALAEEGVGAAGLAAAAARLGEARAAQDDSVADLLARAVAAFPAGYLRLDRAALAAAPAEVGRRALARCLVTVGGGDYAPRRRRLKRLYDALVGGRLAGRTLAGCRVLPWGQAVLICREPAAIEGRLEREPEAGAHWDGRFRAASGGGAPRLGSLGAEGWAEVTAAAPDLRSHLIPPAARAGLPAARDARGVLAVPHLGYWRERGRRIAIAFEPRQPLAGCRFTVA